MDLRASLNRHEAALRRANRKYKAARKGSASAVYWLGRRKFHWRIIARRKKQIAAAKPKPSRLWGGSRTVTNEIIDIVNNRARITSRKRFTTLGNPGSDHYVGNVRADAVDFGIGNAHWLKNEISKKLGGPSNLPDYGTFLVRRDGKTFRVQMIAGTHGTGPHLHVGVKRV